MRYNKCVMIIVERLVWNKDNIAHIARHRVTQEEVEEVCHGVHEVFQTYSGRLALIRPTRSGRMLFIIVAPKGEDIYFPVTARDADKKERQRYIFVKGGGKNGT